MAFVLRAVAQEILMELTDHVFRDRDLLEGIEYLIHDIGVASDLLLVPCLELRDAQAAQQVLDLAIGELRAFDAGQLKLSVFVDAGSGESLHTTARYMTGARTLLSAGVWTSYVVHLLLLTPPGFSLHPSPPGW